jgi:methylmalonyl-CoA mutase
MRPKFIYSDLKTLPFTEKDINEWNRDNNVQKGWNTPEKIPIKSVYTKQDLDGMEHLHYAAGLPPFLHGPYSGMYTMIPWTIR